MNKFFHRGPVKRALSFFIPVLIFFIVLETLLYVWVNVLSPQEKLARVVKTWEVVQDGKVRDIREIGFFDYPRAVIRHTLVGGGKILAAVEYRINEFALRDPARPNGKKASHLILGGCSYVFGEGLRDEETLAGFLRKLYPEVNVRNISFLGGGVQTTLRNMEIYDPRKYAPEEEGRFIYVLIGPHFSRWLRKFEYLWWAPGEFPVYEKENGKLLYQGRLDETAPHFFVNRLKDLTFGIVPNHYFVRPPEAYTEDEVSSLFDGIGELRDRYLALYPKGKFLLALHPQSGIGNKLLPLVIDEAKRRNISLLDATTIYHGYLRKTRQSREDYVIPFDGHPNGKLNAFFAGVLRYNFDQKGR